MNNYDKINRFIENNKNSFKEKIEIKELSRRIGVSPSAITRFCKKKGYNGFKEIKEIIFSKKNNKNKHNLLLKSIDSFYRNCDYNRLKFIANKIINAKNIYILGESFTYLQAKIFERKLMRINIFAKAFNVSSELSIISPKIGSVYIFLSHSGLNVNIRKAAEKINTKGVIIFSIAAKNYTNIKKISNEYILGHSYLGDAVTENELPSISFMSVQLILDELFQLIYKTNEKEHKRLLRIQHIKKDII